MAATREKLGEILKRFDRINDQQLNEALKVAEGSRRRIGEVLVEMGYVKETDVAKALALQFDMEYIDLETGDPINKESLTLLPQDVIRKYLVLPLGQNNGRLKIIIHDPMDLETLDNLRFRLNCDLETAISARGKIKEFIDDMLSETQESIDKAVREMSVDSAETIDIKGLSIDRHGEFHG